MPPESPVPEFADRLRAEHMRRSARDAITILGGRTKEQLATDMVATRALVNCFTEIGEAATRLTPAARAHVGTLPWRQIVGMRNIVVHTYWQIDLNEVVKTTRDDLPSLISALESALANWPLPTTPPGS